MNSLKKIIDRVDQQDRRQGKKVTFYLSVEVYTAFKNLCNKQDVYVSNVVEEWMRGILNEGMKVEKEKGKKNG